MYTVPVDDDPVPEDEPPADEPPDDDDEPDDELLAYTSYCVDGYTTPRICTDEVRIWETTAAVVTVGDGAAESAASCCGDFTKEAPISPPMASNAAAMPTPSSTRRRRASRDPRTACPRPPSSRPLSVAGEPSCVTKSSDGSHAVQGSGREQEYAEPGYRPYPLRFFSGNRVILV
jgi:hypothetical protein